MIVLLILTTLLLHPAQDASVVTEAFDDATALLRQGEYEEALAQYETIQSMHVASAALWHNMGIAHYRLNRLGYAILYFERAARLDSDSEVIRHSLRVARERQVDSFSSLPRPFWRTMQAAVLRFVSPGAWFISGLLFLYGAVLLHIMRIRGRRTLPMGQSIYVVLPLLACGCVIIGLSSSYSPAEPESAVIIVPETTLVEQADSAAPPVEVVHEGLVVDIQTQTPGWVLVQLSNGTRGWVPSGQLESI